MNNMTGKQFYIGVNWDHPAGAALLADTEIVAGVSEERFSKLKNDLSFPRHSLEYCLGFVDDPADIAGVGVVSTEVGYREMLYQYACNLSIADHIREQHEVWYPRIYEGREVDNALVHKDRWITDQYPPDYWAEYDPAKIETYSQDSADIIADFIGIERTRVKRIDHHLCHAHYGYFASPFRGEEAVVITVDGFGDGLNATLSIARDGKLERFYATDKCILGRIYRHVTLLMGMKPLEHEYKVMGLAPYAKGKYAREVYRVFEELIEVDGIDFVYKNKPRDSYFHFKDRLEGYRFDNIAAGMQMWVEDILTRWVENIVKETGIRTLVCSGGVAMNVKAMGKIGALPEVERLFVPGSGSDDSNCIGAAIVAAVDDRSKSNSGAYAVPSLLIGNAVTGGQAVIAESENAADLVIDREVTPEKIARLLLDGIIIGRCMGRMEFGQRALGNRSILADPIAEEVVPRINAMIKNRDFWMPFAPVVLDTYNERYLVNPKEIQSPHMTIGYETTPAGWAAMRAACHASDRTARAQILSREDNPDLYALLLAFEKLSGRGALLNTSFNLHGYPIVNTAQDAFGVFMDSELEGLWLAEGLILKKSVCPAIDE